MNLWGTVEAFMGKTEKFTNHKKKWTDLTL